MPDPLVVPGAPGVPGAETPACAFGDPTCPCQDGDVCHYVDDPLSETMAMTPPAGVETPGQPACDFRPSKPPWPSQMCAVCGYWREDHVDV